MLATGLDPGVPEHVLLRGPMPSGVNRLGQHKTQKVLASEDASSHLHLHPPLTLSCRVSLTLPIQQEMVAQIRNSNETKDADGDGVTLGDPEKATLGKAWQEQAGGAPTNSQPLSHSTSPTASEKSGTPNDDAQKTPLVHNRSWSVHSTPSIRC